MRVGRIAGWTALVAALVVAAGVLLPIPPQFITASELDVSFAATLNFAAAHGYAPGTRLISTFGPLGFVFYDQYRPDTYTWLLAVRAALAAATCWTLAWLGCAAWRSAWGGAVTLLACAPFLAVPDVWFLMLPALAVLIELPRDRPPPPALRAALGAAIGLAALIKFTFLLAAVAVLAPLALADLFVWRRLPFAAAGAALAAVSGWAIAGGPASAAVAYLTWSIRDITAGYASAMQLLPDRWLLLHAIGVSVAVLAAGVWLIQRRLRAGRWATAIGLAAIVYLLFKAGFVRADVHMYITSFGLLVLAILLAVLWSTRPATLAVAAVLVAVLPGGLWPHTVATYGPPVLNFPPIFPRAALKRISWLPIAFDREPLDRVHDQQLATIRSGNPLPETVHGTVDIYPDKQSVVLAYPLEFRPRPVFHSYMAYSPRLARANADFLLDADAPEWLLFRIAPIDRHLAAIDDSLSWPLVLTRYRFIETVGLFALLQRRETPLPWHLEPLGRVEAKTHDLVNVPAADGPIWVRIDIGESRRDALAAALLSASLTYVGIGRTDGRAQAYRVVPALAREGFLLSPVIEDTADFVRLASGGDAKKVASSVTVQRAAALGVDEQPRPVAFEFFKLVIGE